MNKKSVVMTRLCAKPALSSVAVAMAAAAAFFPLLAPPSATAQQIDRGTWELTLAGVGTSNNDFDEHAIGLSGGLGYYLLDALELSVRQNLTYVKTSDTNATNASTALALDLHFPLGESRRWVPFIGGNVGYFYGDNTSDSLEYAAEAGLKYYVNSTTFLYGRAEYQWFTHATGSSDSSSDQQVLYTIGIGFRF
jgi:hypothetical protein